MTPLRWKGRGLAVRLTPKQLLHSKYQKALPNTHGIRIGQKNFNVIDINSLVKLHTNYSPHHL